MTTPEERHFAAFLELYGSLPREGPGDAATTRELLERVPGLRPCARVIDAGCGSGAATLVLAKALPRAQFLAVDMLDSLLQRLRTRVAAADLGDRITLRHRSMLELDVEPETVDLIWSEGAVYNVGVAQALRVWFPLLLEGGCVVFSDACWFVDEPSRPAELVEFWRAGYPDMCDEAGRTEVIEDAGYTCIHMQRLAPEAWRRDYYQPLLQRCELLRPGADAVLLEVIREAEREVELFEQYCEHYGYTFFVAQKSTRR